MGRYRGLCYHAGRAAAEDQEAEARIQLMLVQYQQSNGMQENVYEMLKLEEICMNMHISAYGRVPVTCEGFLNWRYQRSLYIQIDIVALKMYSTQGI